MPTALITGASAGIGKDLAHLCAERGYHLALVARSEGPLAQLNRDTGGTARIILKDLAQPGAAAEVFEAVRDLDVEILINNAGIGFRGKFWELDADDQMRTVYLNVAALTQLTHLMLPSMVARKKGYIMNVSSTASFQPGPLMAIYYASKAYVTSLSEALYNELKGTGVSVTALCPGPTATEFQQRARMTDALMAQPKNMMDSMTVSRAGFEGMLNGKPVVIPGALNAFGAFMTRFAPHQLSAGIARRLQEQKH